MNLQEELEKYERNLEVEKKEEGDYFEDYQYEVVDEEFMRLRPDLVNWECIAERQKLSESFINDFADKLDWFYVLLYNELSDECLQKNINRIPGGYLVSMQNPSLELIARNADIVDWEYVAKGYDYPMEFYKKHAGSMDIYNLNINSKIGDDIKDLHNKKIGLVKLFNADFEYYDSEMFNFD